MSAEELRAEWDVHPEWRAQKNRDAREATLPALLELIAGFRSGQLDVTEFRRRIDSQSKQKETGVWGFRGNAGVMFFTMLWKGAPDEFAPLLRAAISVPANDAEARAAIDRLRELARATKTRTGNKNIHEAFAPFFLSFFWEAQDRENWPMYHPASRDGLERFGLLTIPADPSEAYVAFRAAVRTACQIVSADAWDLEQFLWCVMHPATLGTAGTGSPEVSRPPSSPEDLYEAVATAGLRVPDSLVTTLVLSLLSKRFVILAGISGTGKTQLPLQLARYLSARSPGVAVTEAVPESDERTLYLRVTRSTLKYGVLTVPRRVIDFIELPDRGSGADFTVRLPTGQSGPVRVQNIGFSDESAQHARITLLRATKAWITAAAQPGDIASVALDGDGRPVALGHQTREVRSSMEPVERDVLIAVRSDWTDPRGLLGYWNPLTARYAPSPLVHLCLRAAEDPGSPYLVILDEMNRHASSTTSATSSARWRVASPYLFSIQRVRRRRRTSLHRCQSRTTCYSSVRSTLTKRPTPSARRSWIARTSSSSTMSTSPATLDSRCPSQSPASASPKRVWIPRSWPAAQPPVPRRLRRCVRTLSSWLSSCASMTSLRPRDGTSATESPTN